MAPRRILVTALATFLIVYGGICLLVFLIQDGLVYFPGGPPGVNPSSDGLEYAEVTLETSDGERLEAWHVRAPGERGTVLVCHGNAGNVGGRLPHARVFVDMGLSVLLFDYRGYGNSTGRPSEPGLYEDARAAYGYLVDEAGVDPDSIALYGESLGGAVAVELAAATEVAAVVVEGCFTSLVDVGAHHYPWLPVRWLSRNRFDNLSRVGSLRAPFLAIHSRADEIVPYDLGRALFDAAPRPKTHLVTGGGHNDGGFLGRTEWREVVEDFLTSHL